MPDQILSLYGIQPADSDVQLFGDGLINHTWKITTASTGYILQQVNHSVFKNPAYIDENLARLKSYLQDTYPGYLFISPLPDLTGKTLIIASSGYYRLFPFVAASHSLNVLNKKEEAFEGAKQFGRFSRLLNNFDVSQLHITIPDFHNLSLRYEQFVAAIATSSGRKDKCLDLISFITANEDIVHSYREIVDRQLIPKRVVHHDTKINNVLFDAQHKGICVVDLDTVMPGYFISDVGDMMRTYLSPADEEERDLNRITIRKDFFKAIYDGYIQEMGAVLSDTERGYFIYAGKFLIYMQAIRFLTDYLQDDRYYGQKYEGHNFNRAENQVTLLKRYLEIEDELQKMIS